jgi:hypothetical protein
MFTVLKKRPKAISQTQTEQIVLRNILLQIFQRTQQSETSLHELMKPSSNTRTDNSYGISSWAF